MTPPSFAERCLAAEGRGAEVAARGGACASVLERIAELGIEQVRIGWCDAHGVVRGKTLMPRAVGRALESGLGFVGTVLLKDTSDRTAYRVFEAGIEQAMPGFGGARNLLLLPDPASFVVLPWAPRTAWLRAEAWFDDATPVEIDTRRVLRRALATLAAAGFGLRCGLEIEFHVFRLRDPAFDPSLDPLRTAWPGEPPALALIHPGYNLLTETVADQCAEPLAIVQRTAEGLGLPLTSLEIELGPSQVEAVFDAADALAAADAMVLFRNGVRQALRRAGYHASFVCRPPFPNAMASGWHLHQSLTDPVTGGNAFARATPAEGAGDDDAASVLSTVGEQWLAGLLAHAAGSSVCCAPTINAYGRYRPNALAPEAIRWGLDNRGAMLRVIGGPGDAATRIENRAGEPQANPYLYFASQVHAGLAGVRAGLCAPKATTTPYAAASDASDRLPTSLGAALAALEADEALVRAFGPRVVEWLATVKRSEIARHAQAEDGAAWEAREYFSRY